MFEAGSRFTSSIYVRFGFDPDNGDLPVIVELIDDDGEKHYITGMVQWDE